MNRDDTGGRTVQSDVKLLNIIEHLQRADGAGVTEVADALDISKSTVYEHLSTLRQRGYVVKVGTEYRLGLQFFNHGIYTRRTKPIYPHVKKKVREIAEETGERAWCVVEENGIGYYLYGAKGDNPIYPPIRVGNEVALHQVAGGKAILARLSEDRIDEIVDKHGLPAQTDRTITDRDVLKEHLKGIRERGYAIDDEESLERIRGYGAPLVDEEGVVRGALSVTGPKMRIEDEQTREKILNVLFGSANEVEINVSYKMDQYATPVKKREI